MTHQSQDVKSVLYDGSAITADGQSTALDFGCLEGCPDAEIAITASNMGTGESVVLTLQDYNGSYTNTPYSVTITGNGDYVLPVNNRMVTGSKLRLDHNVTLPSGGSINLFGHVRPRF